MSHGSNTLLVYQDPYGSPRPRSPYERDEVCYASSTSSPVMLNHSPEYHPKSAPARVSGDGSMLGRHNAFMAAATSESEPKSVTVSVELEKSAVVSVDQPLVNDESSQHSSEAKERTTASHDHKGDNNVSVSSDDEDAEEEPATTALETGRWSNEEHDRFIDGLNVYGRRKWQKIAELVGTRTTIQVRSHAQKYFKKLRKESENAAGPFPRHGPKRSGGGHHVAAASSQGHHHHHHHPQEHLLAPTTTTSDKTKQMMWLIAATQNGNDDAKRHVLETPGEKQHTPSRLDAYGGASAPLFPQLVDGYRGDPYAYGEATTPPPPQVDHHHGHRGHHHKKGSSSAKTSSSSRTGGHHGRLGPGLAELNVDLRAAQAAAAATRGSHPSPHQQQQQQHHGRSERRDNNPRRNPFMSRQQQQAMRAQRTTISELPTWSEKEDRFHPELAAGREELRRKRRTLDDLCAVAALMLDQPENARAKRPSLGDRPFEDRSSLDDPPPSAKLPLSRCPTVECDDNVPLHLDLPVPYRTASFQA